MNREVEQIIDAASNGNQKYDAACKAFFKYRETIAPILKAVVSELKDCTNEEIIALIDADSISITDPVSDLPPRIKDAGTEMSSLTEKVIYYDSHFKVKNPKLSNNTIYVLLHIDFEVQNDYQAGYPIIKRGEYYVAREISSQLGILTEETDYGKLEKVYSIWVCNENIPKKLQNTITRYYFSKEDVIGSTEEKHEDYDLMEVIIKRRGVKTGDEDIFKYLSAVFSSDKEKIREYVDLDRPPKIREEIEKMTGMGQSIYNKGITQGFAQGENCLAKLISYLLSKGLTEEAQRAATDEEARKEMYKKYGIID